MIRISYQVESASSHLEEKLGTTGRADRYRIAASRLTPAGFGASRPKETNDTLEGRAQNRRVELVRS
jgi:flagellar motor protein MotB